MTKGVCCNFFSLIYKKRLLQLIIKEVIKEVILNRVKVYYENDKEK